MPSLSSHPVATTVKMLMLGNSGSGKTGSLASLAAAGYRLFIYDFDNGLDILMDPKVLDPKHRGNIFYKTYQDKPVKSGNTLIPQATAWTQMTKDIGDWKEDGKSMGGIISWGPQDILVIDSFTFASDRCFDYVLQTNGRMGQRPQIQDYGHAIDSLQGFLELVTGNAACNVIMTAHLMFLGEELSGARKAFPNTIGQKLAPKIPRYFNNMVLVEKIQKGTDTIRQIQTQGTHVIDLKVSKPSLIPAKMPADLATLFKMLLTVES